MYVLFAIILLFVFLLLLPIRIHIRYENGEPEVYIKVLFFKKSIYTEKIGKIEKPKTAKKKKKKTPKKKTPQATEKKKQSLEDIRGTVDLVLDVLGALKDKFFSSLKITAATVYVSVGSDNAAKTALLYGGICQGVAYLWEFLDGITQLKTVKKSYIHVGCDFSATETVAAIHLILSMRVHQLLGHAFRALKAFLMHKLKNESKTMKKDGNKHE
ncbi:MAG: hypothetical protein J6D21_05945 [Clostridia bacterium]|nr:hypothetical protein [Clostridia bacterium]